MRLDPFYPAPYLQRLGYAYFGMERYEEAVTLFERARKRNSGLSAWMLFAAYGHLEQRILWRNIWNTVAGAPGGR